MAKDVAVESLEIRDEKELQSQINAFLKACREVKTSGVKIEHHYTLSDFEREYWMPDIY